MTRILTYQITEKDEHFMIWEYLRSRGYSHHILTGLKRSAGSVLLNGKPVFLNHALISNDLLQITLEETESSPHIIPVHLELNILYEDDDILVVNKPSDMPVHPSINNYENTLANAVAYYYKEQGEQFVFRCINRLDRDTSGILIIAKHALSSSVLSSAMKMRKIHRTYLAIVQGHIVSAGTVCAPIARLEGSALMRCVDFEHGEYAVTHYEPLQHTENPDLTLLSLRLETGRTHQIRVHMNYLGYPLIGDYLYQSDRSLIGRQALHSWKLEFDHPITGMHMCFTSPLPNDMRHLIK